MTGGGKQQKDTIGTEGTLNNNARWRSLKNQGEGVTRKECSKERERAEVKTVQGPSQGV